MKKEKIRIIPLGGLGEIGMNMMVVQHGRDAIVIDCGVMFADHHLPGVDLILPDFSYVLQEHINFHGVVLTHGHEDHIGAVPFLLREIDVPVYGSRFTLSLIRTKLKEHQLLSKSTIEEIKEGDHIELGPFQIEFLQVSHSIADALAVFINTPSGKILHTGDFKIDPKPVDGRTTDLKRIGELGKEGLMLLLSDSTNVEVPGKSVSESSVYEGLQQIVRSAKGWVILASFASHIPRMRQISELAMAEGRRLFVAGRTMIQNMGIARKLGYITIPDDLLVEEDEINDLPRNELIILSTGTQGEPRAALARMAFDTHARLKVRPGDRVIMSSRFIPGNERAIYSIINHLYRRGAEVYTTHGAAIHVSGHGYRDDLEKVLKLAKPKYFVPVHGEYRHLVKHIQLAQETGISSARTMLLEDGDVLEFKNESAKVVDKLELNRSVVDGRELAEIGSAVLRDRRHLAETGLVVVVAILDAHSGEIVRGPELFSKGVLVEEGPEELLDEARDIVVRTLFEFGAEARTEEAVVQEAIRIAVRRFFKNELARKPVVIPIVLEV